MRDSITQVTNPDNSTKKHSSDEVRLINRRVSFQATRQALNLPKILSNILYHVPANNLLVNAMRVCQFWKRTIDTVPSLQQKLHFAPLRLEKQLYHDGKPVYTLCGLAHKLWGKFAKGRDWEKLKIDDVNPVRIIFSLMENIPGALHPNASWIKMLLIQPPHPFEHILTQPWTSTRNTLKYKGSDLGENMGVIYDHWKMWSGDLGGKYNTNSYLSSGDDGKNKLIFALHSLGCINY